MRWLCPLCRRLPWTCACPPGSPVTKTTSGGLWSLFVQRLKYGEETFLAEWLGAWLSSALEVFPREVALVPVPLHERKLADRGYNQAALIARASAKKRGTKVLFDGLVRVKETDAQAQLSAEERTKNLASGFAATRSFAGLPLIIVDDVVTTGATSDALCDAIVKAGGTVLGVVSVTLARPIGL
jgi:ComF family protein